jgi:hypothetical protein
MQARISHWIDLSLLLSGFVAFVTGLVLLFAFHVGGGHGGEVLGLGRLAWQNLHRSGALAAGVAVVLHLRPHIRLVTRRAWRVLGRRGSGRDRVEVFMYVACAVVMGTGLVLWCLVDGSPPLFGAVLPGPMAPSRHHWVDPHFLVGMLAMVLVAHHVLHRRRLLTTALRGQKPISG